MIVNASHSGNNNDIVHDIVHILVNFIQCNEINNFQGLKPIQ